MVPRSIPSGVLPLLSFVAGYVDGCTYLALFGLFVAQVTGSFVLTGAQLVTPSPVGAGLSLHQCDDNEHHSVRDRHDRARAGVVVEAQRADRYET